MDIREFIEAPNHSLFLGIVRSCCKDVIHDWLSSQGKWKPFLKVFSPILASLGLLRLDWLKVHPISDTGSYGGYISESYVALCRLFPYLCSVTESLIASDLPYEDPPNKTLDDLKVDELKAWLKSRKIKLSKPKGVKINKEFLRKAVEATGWRKFGDPPAIPPPDSDGKDHVDFVRMVISTFNVVASIMSVERKATTDLIARL
jgi:hypothetical protein